MICFDWCVTSEIAFTLPREITYDMRTRNFGLRSDPVHVAWYLVRCSRCPRAFLLKGTDDSVFRLTVEHFLQSRGWIFKMPSLYCDPQELMIICPDCMTLDDCLTDRLDC